MNFNFAEKKIYKKQLRMPGYDYKTPGYYFITLCVHNRTCLFGEVLNHEIHLNAAGNMIKRIWDEIPCKYTNWSVDSLVVMPNHIHAVVVLSPSPLINAPSLDDNTVLSLSELMRSIKTYTMTCYSNGVRNDGWLKYEQHLWQRSYYEHMVRNDKSLEKIREYIMNNPAQWELDDYNPALMSKI